MTQAAPPGRSRFGAIDLALIGIAVIWGANFVLVKAALVEFPPLAFTGLRFTLATAALLLVAGRRGWRTLSRGDLLRLAALGLVGNVGYQPLFVVGLSHTTAANSALILTAAPALVALETHLLGLERLSPRAWAGVILSCLGLALIVLGGPEAVALGLDTLLGDGLTLLAALAWATGTVMTRPLVARASPLLVTSLSSLAAVPVLLALAAPDLAALPWRSISPAAWLGLAASGLLSVSLAYVVWTKGVQRLGAPRTAVYANLSPLVAAGLGVLLLGEQLALLQLVGAAMVLAGIRLARGAALDETLSA